MPPGKDPLFEQGLSFLMMQQHFFKPDFWTAVFTGVLALTTLIAAFVGFRQLQEFRTVSKVQHLLALEEKFTKEPMLTQRRALAAKRSNSYS